jgi:phage tail tape-measure protein
MEGMSGGEGAGVGAGTGAAIGAAIGSFIPVVGTLFGGMIGAGIGAITGAVAADDKISADQTQELASILAEMPDAFADQVSFAEALEGTAFEDMVDELWENR